MIGHVLKICYLRNPASIARSTSDFILGLYAPSRLSPYMYRRYCTDLSSIHTSDSEDEGDTMDLSNVVKKLNQLAHPSLAGSWDNVGLLIEPSSLKVQKILLTNDLTPPVLNEAIANKSNMIISYHPPIFSALKKLSQRQWKEKIVIRCLENRIAVFSPHTTHDCVQGGVNDWLISCFDCSEVKPVEQHLEMVDCNTHSVKFTLPPTRAAQVLQVLKTEQLIQVKDCLGDSTRDSCCFNIQCNKAGLTVVMKHLQESMADVSKLEVTELTKIPKLGHGMGRKAKLKSSISLEEAVAIVKQHLKLDHVRLAESPAMKSVSSVAVCAGSGSSVLRNVTADLYVTGEMSHHDVHHAMYNGSSVILCEHTNTERGYLTVLKAKLQEILNTETEIVVSEVDTDPLKVV